VRNPERSIQAEGTGSPGSRLAPAPTPDVVPAGPPEPVDPDVERAMRGDHDAFRVLVERHQNRIYGFILRMLRCDRDTAADLTQDVFLRVFRGIATFDGSARFVAWMHRIATNVCISEYRRQRAGKRGRPTLSLDAPIAGTDDLRLEPAGHEPDPSRNAHDHHARRAVEAAIAELPEEFRHAVLLRDLQGLSYEEIGELLGVPPGTVRSRIHRGRSILQQRLEEFRP
jgi:RNA polymerase sigma-70 factor (ECF subfamily)